MNSPETREASSRGTGVFTRWIVGGILVLTPLLGGASLLLAPQGSAVVSPEPPQTEPEHTTAESAAAESPAVESPATEAPNIEAPAAEQGEPARPPLEISPAERANGFSECMLPDRGSGYFTAPKTLFGASARFPKTGGIREDGSVDVVIHFNGFPGVSKALAPVAKGVALVGFERGGASAYEEAFQNKSAYPHLLSVVEAGLKEHTKNPQAHIGHLALSCWSAGCSAVRTILRAEPAPRVDAVVLLDGFHSAYEGQGTTINDISLTFIKPMVDFARRAAAGERILYISHSAIETSGYASTGKSTARLLRELNLQRTPSSPSNDPLGLSSYLDQEGLHVRSYKGAGSIAHCDHLRFVADAVSRYIEPAWGTPAAR